MRVHSALDRVTRTLVLSIGIGSVLFTVLGLPTIIQQHTTLQPVFSIAAIVLFCGVPPVMALLSFRVEVSVLRVLAGIHAAGTLVLLAFWVPAMTDPTALAGAELPWIISTITVAATEAAIAVSFLAAWAYMLGIAVASGVVRSITFGSPDASQAIQDAIFVVLISGFLMALVQLTLRAGREQDAAATAAQAIAAATAADQKLERQRNRYRGITRDEVAATLKAALHNTPDSREFARKRAVATLASMGRLSNDLVNGVGMPVAEFNAQLRTAAVANDISFASTLESADDASDIPFEVADAFAEAMTEAMRNSTAHAGWRDGRAVRRTVRAWRTTPGVEVVVKDDGRGFNPRRVQLDRLGLRLGILQRFEELPGGAATIASSSGRGTVVTLRWNGIRREH